jgi:PAS domain S-box-containing protein
VDRWQHYAALSTEGVAAGANLSEARKDYAESVPTTLRVHGDERTDVLCVDDDPNFAELTAKMLELRSDRIDATPVDSPRVALDRLRESGVDCVVSDYDMPEMDGLSFLSEARAIDSDLPFVLFTGKGSEEIAGEAIRAGVSDYIQKGAGRERYDLLTRRVENASEQARERRRRRIAEQRYRQLFEQSVVGIGMSQDGVYREVNSRLAELFGYERSELVDTPVAETIAPADRDRVQRSLRRRESGEVDALHYVVAGLRADGSTVELEVYGGRISYQGAPAVLGIVVPTALVDERRYVPSDRVAAAVAAVETARDRLVARDSAAEVAADPADDATVRDHLETALAELTAASDTVDDASDTTPSPSGTTDTANEAPPDTSEPAGRTVDGAEASLRAACEAARAELGGPPNVDVTTDGEFGVEQSVLTRTVTRLLDAGLGDDRTTGAATAAAVADGFSLRVTSPDLDSRLAEGLVEGVGSRPPPVTDVAKRRYWAVYSTSVASDTVEYRVEGPVRVDEPEA